MDDYTCMVCKCHTHQVHKTETEDIDLCSDCIRTVINSFKRAWSKFSPDKRDDCAARMRLDDYKE